MGLFIIVLIVILIYALYYLNLKRFNHNYKVNKTPTPTPEEKISFDLTFNKVENPMNIKGKYLIVDTETTGLPKNRNAPVGDFKNWPRIIQIAWMLFDKNHELIEIKSAYIKQDHPIPQQAVAIHGLTDKFIKENGEDALVIYQDFMAAASRAKYIVAHNIEFDMPIINSNLLRAGLSPIELKTICTMKRSKGFCAIEKMYGRGYKYPKLNELFVACFFPNARSAEIAQKHNADIDVRITAKCFFKLIELKIINPR